MCPTNDISPNKPLRSTLRAAHLHPSDAIEVLCLLSGRTRKGLAKEAGIHPVTLSYELNGKTHNPDRRVKIAGFFGLVPADIWPDQEEAA